MYVFMCVYIHILYMYITKTVGASEDPSKRSSSPSAPHAHADPLPPALKRWLRQARAFAPCLPQILESQCPSIFAT